MFDTIYIGKDLDNYERHKQYIPVLKYASDFDQARCLSLTKFFYAVWDNIDATGFNFDYSPDQYSLDYIHVFKNGKHNDGVCLFPKDSNPGKRELDYRFFAKKKQLDIQASMPLQSVLDVVYVSYFEPNAQENWEALLEKAPHAKWVKDVKGIHQAHIEAAKVATTDLFYVVDGDAIIVDEFNFDYQVEMWNKDSVHVFRSINPVNDLTYGYGGVKLLPRKQTLEMDVTSTDMTTSISSKFKAVDQISNITAFNTGEFETWKSAFRECAKLSSKIIARQKTGETDERLKTWTTVGHDRPFGEYALAGATAGMEFGLSNGADLRLINDFDWLKEQFNANTRIIR